MMTLTDAQKLMIQFHEMGLTTWIAETGDGYILHMILAGEIIGIFRTDVPLYGKN